MGSMIDGVWHEQEPERKDKSGSFQRVESVFRSWVTPDGAKGPSGEGGFAAEAGRYHLYVSLACPWAHRTLIMRNLKGLEGLIGLSVTHWDSAGTGWTFLLLSSSRYRLEGGSALRRLRPRKCPKALVFLALASAGREPSEREAGESRPRARSRSVTPCGVS